MSSAVPFPSDFHRPEALADWLELTALAAADKDASIGDLQRELDRLNQGANESLLGRVRAELSARSKAIGHSAYPFEMDRTAIQLNKGASKYPAYFFCLALSFHGWKTRKGAPDNPWLLFEELAQFSAKRYLGGEVIPFGTSTRAGRRATTQFRQRVEAMVNALGEGEAFKGSRTFSSKDSKLDLVAYKPFGDRRASQIILFGQCAAGDNWQSKLCELDPESFWDQWLSGGKGKVSAPLRAFFMPHRVFDREEWDKHARRARLLFDRCRVVTHAHDDTSTGTFANRLRACCRTEWRLPI